MKYLLLSIFVNFCLLISVYSEEEIPKNLVTVNLDSYKEGSKTYMAVTLANHEGWHTYWKNPGDAGLPIKADLKIGTKLTAIPLKELEWPIPKKYRETGDQIGFGFSGSYTLFYEFKLSDLKKFDKTPFEMHFTWLICKHVCIPGEIKIPGEIQGGLFLSSLSSAKGPESTDVLNLKKAALPKLEQIPSYLSLTLMRGKEENTLELRAIINQKVDRTNIFDNNLVLTYPLPPFDFQHEYFLKSDQSFMAVTPIAWDGEYQTPVIDLPKNGVFKKPYSIKALFYDPISKRTYIIEKSFKSFDNSYSPIPAGYKNFDYIKPTGTEKKNEKLTTATSKNNSDSSLLYYILLGFIGGLILNIMPCVLPVISLKLFELIKYRQESRKGIFRHNLFYTLGILFTFLTMALVITSLKSFGTEVGWGFQLQSPHFIMIMIIALFVFTLNLFGLFEFSTPGGKHLGNVKTDSPYIGDFLSGVLATILSTPCSAPFLGTALTFAFSASTLTIITVFMAIGLGLAFPFIITGFFPKLVHLFPKPGMWMVTFKKIMGFTLILTIIWLFDVYAVLVDGTSLVSKLLVLLTMILFAFLITKERFQRMFVFLLSAIFFLYLWSTKIDHTMSINNSNSEVIKADLTWKSWSRSAMQAHKEKKELVFIDFTAKWCFTCKVNEKVVLESDEFKKLVAEKNINLLLADWTKRDEIIGSFLKEQGLVGVPAYFIQKEDGTLISLGETITVAKIRSLIE